MTSWLAWHVYQHDRQDELLLQAVAPTLQQFRDRRLIESAFVLRYWDGGPHVRIRVRPCNTGAADEVAWMLPHSVEKWCRVHPSNRPMTPGEYQLLFECFGNSEANPELYPDGTILSTTYTPEHDRYGRGPALAACEAHFDESTRLALAVLAAEASARIRASVIAMTVFRMLRRMAPSARNRWAADVTRSTASHDIFHLSATRLQSMTESPPLVVADLWQSLDDLESRLRACESQDYAPPEVGFGAVAIAAGQRDPATTIDLCVHLFANRIGVLVTDESLIRLAVARALLAEHEAATA